MPQRPHYAQIQRKSPLFLNQWDAIILLVFLSLLSISIWGAQQMTVPYHLGEKIAISLHSRALPGYALHTVLRMFIALFFSLLFTLTIGTLAAKNRQAEKILLPFIDIMQSVPILGFLSLSVSGFIALFPGSQLGPECAAIFAIFTSQVWNMALSFYQSLRTVPKDLIEATHMLHLSAWQRFWRLEVPFALPSLIWNMMVSMSAGWFFVVASEAISVNNHDITLPGIGSYIMVATQQRDGSAIFYAILAMFLVICIYDQLLFRPLIAWSEKFKYDATLDTESRSWFLDLLQRAPLIQQLTRLLDALHQKMSQSLLTKKRVPLRHRPTEETPSAFALWSIIGFFIIAAACWTLVHLGLFSLSLSEISYVFVLGLITAIKVIILIFLCSLLWVPIGVMIGLRPQLAKGVQLLAQFLAAFPANLLYPVLFMLIITFHLNVDIWTTPLMILGTQWYILFNVIAGTHSLPQDFRWVAQNYNVKRSLWWRKCLLPGIFPYYITGAMTAAGGCWNASVVAEMVTWGDKTLYASGLGGYIAHHTQIGDFPRIGLGIAVMSLYVLTMNRFLWRKLYHFAENRFQVSL